MRHYRKTFWTGIGIGLFIGFLAGRAFGQSPSSEARAAYLDCSKVRAEAQPGVYYLTLYRFPKADRKDAAKVLSYALNALSRSRIISAPVWVSDTLARFSVINYAPSLQEYAEWKAAWEKLGQKDTTFGIIAEVIDPYSKKIITTRVDGGWLGPEYQKLKALTYSQAPILPADWFIYHALTSPNYDAFCGIPEKEADFFKGIGIDKAAINRLRANAGANLLFSGVATNGLRRVVWEQGPLGGVYFTLDVEKVDAERDPFRRPIDADGTKFRYDVQEGFAIAPNGLWRTTLFNAVGKRQDTVPETVAKDTSDPHGDGIIRNHHSCIICHKEAGLRPFADHQTKLNQLAPPQSYRYDYVQRIAEFYNEPRLQRQMQFDRETYTAALAECTGGMKPAELSEALLKCVSYYARSPVTLETAAREVGQTPNDFKLANVHSNDPHIVTLIHGGETLRGTWESSYAAAALTAEAYKGKK